MFLVDVNTPIQCLLLIVLTPVIILQRICFSAFECTFVLLDSRILFGIFWDQCILGPQDTIFLSVAGLVLRMGSPRKLRNTTEVEEFCQGFRVVEVFVGGGEGGVVQGVINVCYRPRVRLCGEERARLGPATSGTAESAASHSFLQSVQPLSGSLNLGFNSTRTSPENRTAQTLFFLPQKLPRPQKWFNFSRR